LVDNIYALVNVVIANLIQIDLVSHVISSHEVATIVVATTVVAQAKEGLYHDQHSIDAFLPLTIKVFRSLHQQVDDFFHQCVDMAWSAKGTSGLALVILHVSFRQRVLVALHKTQTICILRHAIIVNEGFSRLSVLSCFPSLFLSNMFHEISGRVLEHDLFLCPFVTHFGFCPSSSNLCPFFVPSFSPFVRCFVYWCLARFHQYELYFIIRFLN
jgi:hypothetical protein